ncbi:hypothetical protein [Embleya scabrispora]|uniref:hypothetical protein n=1 Tax=Embleya scabrispora TaxID=159449 RepID=UPI00137500B6|nr:hypothetical protein [Embleya scabrispora]
MNRRRMLAVLIQRAEENRRLRLTLTDAVTIAEYSDPVGPQRAVLVEQAHDQLVRRHPDHYRLIRELLAPHELHPGVLDARDSEAHGRLRTETFAALDRTHPRP